MNVMLLPIDQQCARDVDPREPPRPCNVPPTTANKRTFWQITNNQYFYQHNVIINL